MQPLSPSKLSAESSLAAPVALLAEVKSARSEKSAAAQPEETEHALYVDKSDEMQQASNELHGSIPKSARSRASACEKDTQRDAVQEVTSTRSPMCPPTSGSPSSAILPGSARSHRSVAADSEQSGSSAPLTSTELVQDIGSWLDESRMVAH
eukprot:4031213-Amphidinium_carterae.1